MRCASATDTSDVATTSAAVRATKVLLIIASLLSGLTPVGVARTSSNRPARTIIQRSRDGRRRGTVQCLQVCCPKGEIGTAPGVITVDTQVSAAPWRRQRWRSSGRCAAPVNGRRVTLRHLGEAIGELVELP